MSQLIGVIKKGQPTKNHGNTLRSLGYNVEESEDFFRVEVTEFVDQLDLTEDPKEVLRDLVQNHKALTYQSRVLFATAEGTEMVFRFVLCNRLEKLMVGASALVMKREKKKKAAQSSTGSVLDLLNS